MASLELLDTAHRQFATVLAGVGPGDWDKPTPCEDWSVARLVAHLIGGEQMAVGLLSGCSRDDAMAMISSGVPEGDLVDGFARASAASRAAFDAPGAMEMVVHHPIGDVAGSQLFDFRVGDLSLHSWDLARAIGADEALDATLVTAAWDSLSPLSEVISSIGIFGEGPSGAVAEDAELQLRLLDLTGRRP